MSNGCVVFTIGDDIVKKLKALKKNERMDFVLGLSDNDYFGDHFLAIEELNSQWIVIFKFFTCYYNLNYDYVKTGEVLAYDNSAQALLLEQSDMINEFLNIYNNLDPVQLANFYNELVSHEYINKDELCFGDFIYHMDNIKEVCEKAVIENGSLLFSIECPIENLMIPFL